MYFNSFFTNPISGCSRSRRVHMFVFGTCWQNLQMISPWTKQTVVKWFVKWPCSVMYTVDSLRLALLSIIGDPPSELHRVSLFVFSFRFFQKVDIVVDVLDVDHPFPQSHRLALRKESWSLLWPYFLRFLTVFKPPAPSHPVVAVKINCVRSRYIKVHIQVTSEL